eukprot:scaffold7855_cov39-Prasinocladus_malaysianus.AAC.1
MAEADNKPTAGAVTVSPSELKFRFELRKQIPVTLSLTNTGSTPVAFKVKTTSPKKYIVRPSTGSQKEFPPDLSNCKDKFLVQTVELESLKGEKPEVNAELFDKSNADKIIDTKLKVVLVAPPAPPSPVPEGEEGEDGAKRPQDPKYASTIDDLAAATKEVNTLKDKLKKMGEERNVLMERMQMLELQVEGKPP